VPGNSLYFVARGDGSHVFSADLDAHNAAVKEFQLKRRADYRSSPAPVTTPAPAAEAAQPPETAPDKPAEAPIPAPEASVPQIPESEPVPESTKSEKPAAETPDAAPETTDKAETKAGQSPQ